jgi:hypothetical protein
MLVKVVGEFDGLYSEETYENVLRYRVANCPDGMAMLNGDVYSGGKNPYTRITMYFEDDSYTYVYFNTTAYAMTDAGTTVDVLTYKRLEK